MNAIINWTYGVQIARDGPDFVVNVRDLPEVLTAGDTLEQALELAVDAIDAIMQHRMDKGEALPAPSPLRKGEHPVSPSALTAAKASLNAARDEAHVSKVELAKRLGAAENQARRLLDARHPSTLAALDRAARALGYQLVVSARKIA